MSSRDSAEEGGSVVLLYNPGPCKVCALWVLEGFAGEYLDCVQRAVASTTMGLPCDVAVWASFISGLEAAEAQSETRESPEMFRR